MFAMFFIGFVVGLIAAAVAVLYILNSPRILEYLDKRASDAGYDQPMFNVKDIRRQK